MERVLTYNKKGEKVIVEQEVKSSAFSNEAIKVLRAESFYAESDKLFTAFKSYEEEAEEASTDFERDMLLEKAQQLRTAWLAKKQEIRERFPYKND
jgi:hypothetical protein